MVWIVELLKVGPALRAQVSQQPDCVLDAPRSRGVVHVYTKHHGNQVVEDGEETADA